MKKSRYSDSQILNILKQAENGVPVAQLCREHGMSSATFYKWRSKYGGMDASLMARMKELEKENRMLKRMYADEKIKAEIVARHLQKIGKAVSPPRDGPKSRAGNNRKHPASLRSIQHQPNLLSLRTEALG